jgi:hypothetical protein
MPSRVQLWWLLEGKQFPLIGGSLSRCWSEVLKQARRLLAVHSPADQSVQVPEGEIDWVSSALQRITSGRTEFRVRASRTGLSDDERTALAEWTDWIGRKWAEYVASVGVIADVGVEPIAKPGPDRIKWWAHIAGRSRWPLLRHVVTGSLRVFLEEDVELDAIPLPTEHWRLFELLCMVRVLRTLEDFPRTIRWLDASLGNAIHAGGCKVSMQHRPRHPVLDTNEFAPELRAAIDRHDVRVPTLIDVLLEFNAPRARFAGLLIEAKSGAQGPEASIPQLRAYRAALRAQGSGRLLVWGIVETSWPWVAPPREELAGDTDVWVFSDADHIGRVLADVGLVKL